MEQCTERFFNEQGAVLWCTSYTRRTGAPAGEGIYSILFRQ